jgi:hypothetical protein
MSDFTSNTQLSFVTQTVHDSAIPHTVTVTQQQQAGGGGSGSEYVNHNIHEDQFLTSLEMSSCPL